MRYRDVEQAIFWGEPCSTVAMVPTCSLWPRTRRAAFGGGLWPSLTFAARAGLPKGRSGRRDVGFRSNNRMTSGRCRSQPGNEGLAVAHDGAAFARLLETGHHTDVGGERRRIGEAAEIAEFGDEADHGVGADARDRGEQRADLVFFELAADVVVQFPDASAQQVQVLAGVADLDAVGGTMMVADRDLGRPDQRRGQLRADLVDAVVDQLGETSRRSTGKGLGVRVLGQQRASQHAVQALNVATELRKAETNQAMQLTD